MKHIWTIRLSAAAEQDFREIVGWTVKNFGRSQAGIYAKILSDALHDLALGPSIPGVRQRDDIGTGIHTLHVARKGRKGRHLIAFRMTPPEGEHVIDVLRLLHDSMDLSRNLPATNESSGTPDSQQ